MSAASIAAHRAIPGVLREMFSSGNRFITLITLRSRAKAMAAATMVNWTLATRARGLAVGWLARGAV